jgi:hypothetical protein
MPGISATSNAGNRNERESVPSCTKRLSGNLLVEAERPLSLRFNPEIDIRSHNPDRAREIDIAGTGQPHRVPRTWTFARLCWTPRSAQPMPHVRSKKLSGWRGLPARLFVD